MLRYAAEAKARPRPTGHGRRIITKINYEFESKSIHVLPGTIAPRPGPFCPGSPPYAQVLRVKRIIVLRNRNFELVSTA